MRRRKTVARWLSNVLPTPENNRKAEQADRRIDQRIGAMKRGATLKTPETDWRRLLRKGQDDE